MAAFEAVGYAKFSGEVGVCMATSGPGAIHLLNGLYDAKLDHVPVLAIVGQTARSAMGGSYQQEIDLALAVQGLCHQFVEMRTVPQQLPNLIDRAIRVAAADTQSPTCIIIPYDVQELDVRAARTRVQDGALERRHQWPTTGRPTTARSARRPRSSTPGPKIAILVGQGARGAREEVTQVAEISRGRRGQGAAGQRRSLRRTPVGSPVRSDFSGRGPSYELMMDCDTLLTVGSNFPYTQFMPPLDRPGPSRSIMTAPSSACAIPTS